VARASHVYIIFCGARRDHPMGAWTVKHEMAGALRGLVQDRSDLLVKRFRDGRFDHGVIMSVDDILKEQR
jgi:hypothetical protein